MFDTMTLTKILGGACGSLLVFLLGSWVAETVYHSGGGHGDDHAQAYVIDVPESGAVVEEEVIDVAMLMAEADIAEGEKVFRKCSSCHAIEDGVNGAGPHLYGVVGREVGGVESFAAYSGVLSEVAPIWTAEELFAFLEKPSSYARGTTMTFNGLPKPSERADLIAYLDSLDD